MVLNVTPSSRNMRREAGGILHGLKVVEFGGQGPGPFCGMMLADMGAEVLLVEREVEPEGPRETAIFHRGKKSIVLNLKNSAQAAKASVMIAEADCVVEGFRPGVMERLGLGPDVCCARNPRLVYGRMTGWGQSGPLATSAGHDINYAALGGALWYCGMPGDAPFPPPTLIGDVGGGALFLVVGLLAGVMHARSTGEGQVIDAAIVDGVACMSNILLSVQARGLLAKDRGASGIDGSHWCTSYRCSDGRYITIAAIEAKFYTELLTRLGLESDPDFADQHDASRWPWARKRLAAIFAARTLTEWCALLDGTDCCFAPVLTLDEAAIHPHLAARGTFLLNQGQLQAGPAPRFSAFDQAAVKAIPRRGEHQWLAERDSGFFETSELTGA
jgi:alpha-methylacyl-CoA racemase